MLVHGSNRLIFEFRPRGMTPVLIDKDARSLEVFVDVEVLAVFDTEPKVMAPADEATCRLNLDT